jgi:hypothetical protein
MDKVILNGYMCNLVYHRANEKQLGCYPIHSNKHAMS